MAATQKKATFGPQLEPHQIILSPLVTEKGTHQSSKYNAYSFEVNPLATKIQIAAAVTELFNVKVEKVRTQTRKGKHARYRQVMGVQSAWKKAIVTLDENDKIDFF